jgi:hypothetical protein
MLIMQKLTIQTKPKNESLSNLQIAGFAENTYFF